MKAIKVFLTALSCLALNQINAQNQKQSLDTALYQNGQYIVTNKIIETLDLNSQAGFISLNDQKYLINYVPYRDLSVVLLDNKSFYQQKLDSLSVLFSNAVDKDDKKELKAQIKKYNELKKNSPSYRNLGLQADSLFTNYSLKSTADAAILVKSNRWSLSDPVVPIYIVGGQVKDTLVVLNMVYPYGERPNLLQGFLLSDLNPAQIEKRKREKIAKDRQEFLARVYKSNPLYTDKKDWTLDVFKDTAVYLHKNFYKLTKLGTNEIESPVYKVIYRFSNSREKVSLDNYEEKVWNANIKSNEFHEYSHTEVSKISLMDMWVGHAENKSSGTTDFSGITCDTMYYVNYPSDLLKNEIFEGEFKKRNYNNIKYDNFKGDILKGITIDTVLMRATSYSNSSQIVLKLEGNSRQEEVIVETRIGENGYSITLDGSTYDTRLGEPNYVLKRKHRDDEWNYWVSDLTSTESFAREWFNSQYNDSKEYYKEKLEQQEEEKKQLQKLYSKYGTKYVKAAEEFEVIVGMHEDLLAYSLKLWKVDRRSRTSNGYTLYCYSILDTSVRLVVTVTNSKVSYVSY